VARAVLRIAVERQVGQDEPEAIGQVLGHRLPLLVAEQHGVQEHEPGAGARLAVRDPRAVAVVEEAQLHPVASPARSPRASARVMVGLPAASSESGRAALSIRCWSSAWMPFV
jgi:hypothetical protein